jgi:outer membrane biosynthesis protein TonB
VRSFSRALTGLVTILVAASCGGNNQSASDDLLRDLSAAQASSVELAARVQDYQPTRFVTAVEQLPQSTPTRARAPRRTYTPPAVDAVPLEETMSDPEPAQEIVQTPIPEPDPQPTQVSAVPTVQPRPAATPATPAPTGETDGAAAGPSRGEVLGTIIGEAIGVVIRGGPVGPGHCPPRRGRGRGFPLPLDVPQTILRGGHH